ncbi:hypothetical protein UPYG_G00018760 [Umbra pygmaea]|uniref:Uncharacterized protein n=1 Tax=Umbra pygmaea TaxID=75934 RepID=A0ABD0XMV9_UMBPY
MKAVCFSLILLLLTCSFGEGLKCNQCISKGCTTTVQTCPINMDTCVTAMFLPPGPVSYFKRCIKKSDCMILQASPYISAQCCYTDRCN